MDACGVSASNRADETSQRTAKSCGPGAATLASIRPCLCGVGNGDNKGRSPGRARISRQPIARGRPGCLGCTCQTRVRFFLPIAHGDAGAVGARSSLRPLFKGEQRNRKPRTNRVARMSTHVPTSLRAKRPVYACCASYAELGVRRSSESEGGSNPALLSQKKAGLLRFARNDG